MRIKHKYVLSTWIILLAGCSVVAGLSLNERYGEASVQTRSVAYDSASGENYTRHVQPILEQRCVVCHGCYDAPCQFKLTSTSGIDRGASKAVLYDSSRLAAAPLTRLNVDATTTAAWRARSFYPMLNERRQSSSNNQHASVVYNLLSLKNKHPLPDQDLLPDSFTLGVSRDNQCPKLEEVEEFSRQHPLWGMPYALPGLTTAEFDTVSEWLIAGAPMPDAPPLGDQYLKKIEQWEAFLNQDSSKGQLVGRYLYEHLFLANLYFDKLDTRTFFKVVRSTTPSGAPIEIIPSRRPYDSPGVDKFYYRLQVVDETILAKTHMPYALNPARLARWQQWFFATNYEVTALPSYTEKMASNPFITFRELPFESRYRFLLDEAQFTIMNFIKGPVCRGQVALNVIRDHFWVFFKNPDIGNNALTGRFLAEQSNHLQLPAGSGNTLLPINQWYKYSKLQREYLQAKFSKEEEVFNSFNMTLDTELIWDGDKTNSNAALTIFRHFDSATVLSGLVGKPPETSWVIGYPLLERIHYLLVAGFDPYGNIGHQMLTRLYMDFLRMEGEFNFLSLLPKAQQKQEWQRWYDGASDATQNYVKENQKLFYHPTDIVYHSSDQKQELYTLLRQRLAPVLTRSYALDHPSVPPAQARYLKQLSDIEGYPASLLPQVVHLMVTGDRDQATLYSVIHNNAHSNITSLLREESNRRPLQDTITVMRGIVGDYPGAFWQVDEAQLPELVAAIGQWQKPTDYGEFMQRYGIRRTNPDFWRHSDKLHRSYRQLNPVRYGLLDFNRLENR